MASYVVPVKSLPLLSSSPLNTPDKEKKLKHSPSFLGQMNARAYVLIFFFWAVIIIITPTLILLSESSKHDIDQNGKINEVMKPRKMMAYFEKHQTTPDSPAVKKLPHVAPAPAPTPGPAPAPAAAPAQDINGTDMT